MNRRPWTDTDDAILRRDYPHQRAADVAVTLGRSITSIYGRAKSLGIEKSPEFLSSPLSGRTTGDRGHSGRFKKGVKPWNTGKPFNPPGRSAETRFKPGRMPHNNMPVGTYRICLGYLQQKISDDPGPNHVRWRGVHELVWIAQNGPLPKGHFIGFKPGRKTTVLDEITIDAVELRSRKSHMLQNSIHNYPQPIPQLTQLRGALQRKINHRMRRQNGKEQD